MNTFGGSGGWKIPRVGEGGATFISFICPRCMRNMYERRGGRFVVKLIAGGFVIFFMVWISYAVVLSS